MRRRTNNTGRPASAKHPHETRMPHPAAAARYDPPGMSGRGGARTREKDKPRKPRRGQVRVDLSKRRNATAGRIVRCLQRGRNGETGAGNYGSRLLTSDSDSDSLSDSLSSLLVCIEHSRLGRLRTA
jgi:hypothetical protein